MLIQFYYTKVRSETCQQSKNNIKANNILVKPTLENYDGTTNENLKQDILREYLEYH